MKLKNYQLLLAGALMVYSSCSKDEQLQSPDFKSRELQVANVTADGHLPLTVTTIAGKYNTEGYADGVGEQARLLGISGIDLADDGALYAADFYNHRIRKITMPNIVSTVNIPKNSEGETLFQPSIIRVENNGTMNILAAPYDYQNTHSRFWIIKPGSNVAVTPARHNVNYNYYDLEKDPYNSYLFIGGSKVNVINDIGYPQSIMEKFLPDVDGTYGKDAYFPPVPPLFDNIPYVSSFFCGYNAVKYVILHGEFICKLTPSGVFQQIYRDQKFYSISDIVATKDSQTLYIADNGAIKALTDGKVRYLVGPHKGLKGRDGVGANADVYAYKLALSKDESTLYFSDGHTTIRKLLLR